MTWVRGLKGAWHMFDRYGKLRGHLWAMPDDGERKNGKRVRWYSWQAFDRRGALVAAGRGKGFNRGKAGCMAAASPILAGVR